MVPSDGTRLVGTEVSGSPKTNTTDLNINEKVAHVSAAVEG